MALSKKTAQVNVWAYLTQSWYRTSILPVTASLASGLLLR